MLFLVETLLNMNEAQTFFFEIPVEISIKGLPARVYDLINTE